jgi:tetratricopeptide (TPR) repeat protein
MGATWEVLREEEQKTAFVALKSSLEAAVSAPARLKTPPKIVLAMWSKGMPSRATSSTGNDPTEWQRNFSATASAARLLTDLGNRFNELGMPNERRSALQLLRNIKPANMDQDKESRAVWAQQLISLAEDYRTSNEYLEAGRIYSFVGSESENWEGRAEALYKGGLLLYRSGRREEALEAFKKAKADGNNLFYANLANERLNQIETK